MSDGNGAGNRILKGLAIFWIFSTLMGIGAALWYPIRLGLVAVGVENAWVHAVFGIGAQISGFCFAFWIARKIWRDEGVDVDP